MRLTYLMETQMTVDGEEWKQGCCDEEHKDGETFIGCTHATGASTLFYYIYLHKI